MGHSDQYSCAKICKKCVPKNKHNKKQQKIFCHFVVKGFLNSSGLCINILFALKPTQGFSLKPQCIKLNKTQQ